MDYDESVSTLCEEAVRLSKMEGYRLFNRWKVDFKGGDLECPHKYTERGIGADRLLKDHRGSDFYALFEYLNDRPVGYECIRMKGDIERVIDTDCILIGKDFSWSILFSQHDEWINGPFYFRKEELPDKGIQADAEAPRR
jgi:hypothetical protein